MLCQGASIWSALHLCLLRLTPPPRLPQVKLNARTISSLQLSVDAGTVAMAILNTPKLKLKPHNVNVRHGRCSVGSYAPAAR